MKPQTSNQQFSVKKSLTLYFIASAFLIFEMAVQVSPSVMTTQLMQHLQMSVFGLGIMSGCYFYSYTAMQIPSGILLDRFNPRFVMVSAILTCVLGCVLLGSASTMLMACFARLLMGFGSAFAFVSVLVVTADLFSSRHFAVMTGMTQMLAALGAMSGQLPVHFLVTTLGWRNTLFVFAIIGTVIATLVFYFLHYKRIDTHTLLNNNINIKAILRNKQTWFVAIYACLLWAPMSAFTSLWGVPFLKNIDHLSAANAAFFCSLMWIGLAIASPLLGFLSTRAHNRKLFLILSAGLGLFCFSIILFFKLKGLMLAALLFLAGAACSGQALSFTVVKENNHRSVAASAIAFNNMAVVISGALFQPFVGWLLNETGNYRLSLSIVLIAYLLGFLMAVFGITETALKRQVERQ
ncbi:MAG: hypothetical protein A3E82_01225 [Gammaproteobacteria bacterium RIFCSPHIGHO2_12_FULL_38_11]|nr:MAG: hypothetical protein A3E82_01225 [Gammaproteobacteria bacterium RIFCSPHIGHO2_12_FULL_38_11]